MVPGVTMVTLRSLVPRMLIVMVVLKMSGRMTAFILPTCLMWPLDRGSGRKDDSAEVKTVGQFFSEHKSDASLRFTSCSLLFSSAFASIQRCTCLMRLSIMFPKPLVTFCRIAVGTKEMVPLRASSEDLSSLIVSSSDDLRQFPSCREGRVHVEDSFSRKHGSMLDPSPSSFRDFVSVTPFLQPSLEVKTYTHFSAVAIVNDLVQSGKQETMKAVNKVRILTAG